ncbi:MAG: zinc-ribbon domain-containing protein [Lachnospiraceae bacterium]|nr:zinc-ribbon domain-containing protein [Lachnospiraceae bacterium]
MIICPACGKKNEDGEILCSDCGAKLKATERLQRGFAPKSTVAEPVKPLAEPVAKPAEPVTKPAEPVVKPAEPVAKSAEPVIKPAEPAAKPAEPVIKPAEPVTKPADPVVKPEAARSAVNPEYGNASAGNWNEVKFNAPVHRKTPEFSLGMVFCAVIAVLFFIGGAKALAFSATHSLTDITLYSSYSYDNYSYTLQDHPDVYSSDGEKKEYTSGMKLRNGDRIVTGKHINASLNLGVDRTLTMMSVTETVVHQDDDETRIDLNKGAMFFDIDTPYSGREKLELVSGSVVIPITEGAGYMFYNGTDDFRIWVMNGEIQVSVYDGSGNTTTETITPGESAFIDISDEGVGFTVEKVGVDSLPSAMIRELSVNNGLLNVISPEAEWDRDDILRLAEEYKSQDLMYNFGVMPYWILNGTNDD